MGNFPRLADLRRALEILRAAWTSRGPWKTWEVPLGNRWTLTLKRHTDD